MFGDKCIYSTLHLRPVGNKPDELGLGLDPILYLFEYQNLLTKRTLCQFSWCPILSFMRELIRIKIVEENGRISWNIEKYFTFNVESLKLIN